MQLSAPVNATLARPAGTGTIKNGDRKPSASSGKASAIDDAIAASFAQLGLDLENAVALLDHLCRQRLYSRLPT